MERKMSSSKCIVCKKYFMRSNKRSFHKFPKNSVIKFKWMRAIGRITIPKFAVVCSDHFDDKSFEQENRDTCIRKLLPKAVPNLLLKNESKELVETNKNVICLVSSQDAEGSDNEEKSLINTKSNKTDDNTGQSVTDVVDLTDNCDNEKDMSKNNFQHQNFKQTNKKGIELKRASGSEGKNSNDQLEEAAKTHIFKKSDFKSELSWQQFLKFTASKNKELRESCVKITRMESKVKTLIATIEELENCLQAEQVKVRKEKKRLPNEFEGRKLISKVYHYLELEYECIKALGKDYNLALLSNIVKRTAEATGVSEPTVATILAEEKPVKSGKQEKNGKIQIEVVKYENLTDDVSILDNNEVQITNCGEEPVIGISPEEQSAEIETLPLSPHIECEIEIENENPGLCEPIYHVVSNALHTPLQTITPTSQDQTASVLLLEVSSPLTLSRLETSNEEIMPDSTVLDVRESSPDVQPETPYRIYTELKTDTTDDEVEMEDLLTIRCDSPNSASSSN